MSAAYTASRPVKSNDRETLAAAVRSATFELMETLHIHGIEVSFRDLARAGHSESWDGEGQRWVHVTWGY